MKKIIVLFSISLFSATALMAQNDARFKFSTGPELAFATGTFGDSYSIGSGATGQAELNVQEKLYATVTSGFLFFNGKAVPGTNGIKYTDITIIPIKIGIKYFLVGGVYVAAQTGIGILNKGLGTYFAYSPLIGYEFMTNSARKIDASFKYDGYSGSSSSISALGVRVAYIF